MRTPDCPYCELNGYAKSSRSGANGVRMRRPRPAPIASRSRAMSAVEANVFPASTNTAPLNSLLIGNRSSPFRMSRSVPPSAKPATLNAESDSSGYPRTVLVPPASNSRSRMLIGVVPENLRHRAVPDAARRRELSERLIVRLSQEVPDVVQIGAERLDAELKARAVEQASFGVERAVALVEDDGEDWSRQRPTGVDLLIVLIQLKPAERDVVSPDELDGGRRPPALLERQVTTPVIKGRADEVEPSRAEPSRVASSTCPAHGARARIHSCARGLPNRRGEEKRSPSIL